MIKIKYPYLEISDDLDRRKATHEFQLEYLKLFPDNFKKELDKILKSIDKTFNSNIVLGGNFEQLKELATKYSRNKSCHNWIELNNLFYSGKKEFKYKNFQRNIADFLIDGGVIMNSCHYCNIDYINSFDSLNKKKDHFTLDHLLSKKDFPFLSLSLYNLVPSCYPCNSKFKRAVEFKSLNFLHKISPSSEYFELDKLLEFKLNFSVKQSDFDAKIESIKEIKEIEITLKNLTSEIEIDYFVNMFELKGRYEFHKNISYDLIKKRKVYSDSQIEEIEKLFFDNGILIDKETFKKQIFGSIIFEKENTNEPFEKYKKDIARQLGLVE